jgi:ParB family chromosome partitioning protein
VTKINGNLALAGFGDIFNAGLDGEQVAEISLAELHSPEFNPFSVVDDDAMTRLAESIKRYGVREPGIARRLADGGYELLAGNRRKRACEIAGLRTMPVIVREMDDDNAVITMVDSNLEHREKLLFSEKAWAYRIKLEALDHNGVKNGKLSAEVLVEQTGESKNQIYRLVRLTELVPDLLDKVDSKQLAFNPAVELSYLSRKEQANVVDIMTKYEVKPSLSQAVRLKKIRQGGTLTKEVIDSVLAEAKKPPKDGSSSTRLRRFFPPEYSPKQIETVIIGLLREWQKTQNIQK